VIVVDASILANALADDDEDGRKARHELRIAGDLTAPDLVDVETVAVLRKRWLARTISDQRFNRAVGDLERLDFERVPTLRLVRPAYELRASVTVYDATIRGARRGPRLRTAYRRPALSASVCTSLHHPRSVVT
jgi:predicted nucleic acid-binding protein